MRSTLEAHNNYLNYWSPWWGFPNPSPGLSSQLKKPDLPLEPWALPKRLPCSPASYFHQADLPSQIFNELYSPHCLRNLILVVWQSLSNKRHEE